MQGQLQALPLFIGLVFPELFQLGFAGFQQAGRMLEQFVGLRGGLSGFVLEAPVDFVHSLVQPANNKEHIDADDGMGKKLFCGSGISVVHVTAEILHPAPLFGCVLAEILFQVCGIDFGKDIQDDAGIPFKFINTEGLRQLFRDAKGNGFLDAGDDARGDAVAVRDLRDREHFSPIHADAVVEQLCEVHGSMNPFRLLIVGGTAAFAAVPAFEKGEQRAAAGDGDMEDSLLSA